ncbi:MAG TPA: DUF2529 domain-containing protein [Pseudoneobacillus sp.]|nr:DUF2529 domain-containing protein [Pseudoneobacillus sp.]
MLKMFSTQLAGLFKRIHEKDEFIFEDGARLLAQAAVGNGSIFIFGNKEMEAVALEAIVGAEPFRYAKKSPDDVAEIKESDRAIVVSRFSTDEEAVECAKALMKLQVPFVALATKMETSDEDLFDLADVAINLQLTKGLLPDETGNRFGFPSVMAALFAYYGLKFTYDEILAEYEDEEEK